MSFSTARRERSLFNVFSLIELLVVIAIISILSSLLLPALNQAKKSARASLCLNNLKQSHLHLFNYTSDFDEFLPASVTVSSGILHYWPGILAKCGYLGKKRRPIELMCTEQREREKKFDHKVPKITNVVNSASLYWRYTYGFGIFSSSEITMHMRITNMPVLDNAGRRISDRFLLACDVGGKTEASQDQWYQLLKYSVDGGIFYPVHARRANLIYLDGSTGNVNKQDAWDKWFAQSF